MKTKMKRTLLISFMSLMFITCSFAQVPTNRIWSTYIGGNEMEQIGNMDVDSINKMVYVVGNTSSRNLGFATLNSTTGNAPVGFVSKYSMNGARIWSRYIGSTTTIRDMVYDYFSGCIYVVGHGTDNTVATFGSGTEGLFIQKYASDGTLIWGTYFGFATNGDIAVDETGNLYISANAPSNVIATAGTFQTAYGSSFFAKLSSSGTTLWCSYFGGTTGNFIQDIQVKNGNVIICGTTQNSGYASATAHATTNQGQSDAFVGSFSAADGTRNWSTYLGGAYFDVANFISIDPNDNIYVGGSSNSASGIATSGTYLSVKPSTSIYTDGFLTKFNSSGQQQWGTYVGASNSTSNIGYISFGINDELYFCGQTDASSLATSGAYDGSVSGNDDILGAIDISNGALNYLSYYGGSQSEFGLGVRCLLNGDVLVFGETRSDDVLAMYTSGAEQSNYGGSGDLYLSYFSPNSNVSLCNEPTTPPSGITVNGITANTANITFNSGNGDNRIIFLSTSNTISGNPLDGSIYSGVSLFGAGATIGNSNLAYSLNNGNINAVSVSGLQGSTCYYIYVYEYNCDGVASNYLTSSYALDSFCTSISLTVGNFNYRHWATYMSANSNSIIRDVATDAQGNVVVVGEVAGDGFATRTIPLITSGAYQTTSGGGVDVIVAKFDQDGQRLWGTFLGGSDRDAGTSVEIDKEGNIYISGIANSTNFPTTSGAHSASYNGGSTDGFLASFTPNGALRWSTYIGGSDHDNARSISIDTVNDYLYVSGFEYTSTNSNGDVLGYLKKFNLSGSLIWSADVPDITEAVFARGSNIVVVGRTSQSTINLSTSGAYQTTYGGDVDGFIASYTSAGSMSWATYYGGSDFDDINNVIIGTNGNIYVSGQTASTISVSSGAFQTSNNGGRDGILAKFSSSGAKLWDTYFGGSAEEYAYGLAIDDDQSIYMAGHSNSSGLATSNAYQTSTNGNLEGYVAKFNANGTRLFTTYYGGSQSDGISALALDKNNQLYIAGASMSASNIATTGSFDDYLYGALDGFLVKFSNTLPILPCGSPTQSASNITWNTNDFFNTGNNSVIYDIAASGNGSGRIVIVNHSSYPRVQPTDGVVYTENSSYWYGAGAPLGGGYTVYNGSFVPDMRDLNGLSPCTSYDYYVYDYNICNGLPVYSINYAQGNFGTPCFRMWNGTQSTSWNNPKNWEPENVPSINDSVVIDTIKVYAPQIDVTGNAKHITITKNGVLTVSGSLNVYGTLTNRGKLKADQQNSTMVFKDIYIPGHPKHVHRVSGNREFKVTNLEYDIDSVLYIDNELKVMGLINPLHGTLYTNGNLELIGKNGETGHILAFQEGADLKGNILIQKKLQNGKAGSMFISSPMDNSQLKDLKNDISLSGMNGANPNGAPNTFYYNESVIGTANVGYTSATHINNYMKVGQGWRIDASTKPSELNFEGSINKGTITLPVTYTKTSFGASNDGWNLVGNPYPCNIDWNNINGFYQYDIDSTLYIWSADKGKYVTYNSRLGGTNGGTSTISHMQAFLVKANSKNAYIALTEGAKTKGKATYFKRDDEEVNILRITLIDDSSRTDETMIAIRDDASDAFDKQYDAYKLAGKFHNIATTDVNQVPLAVQVIGNPLSERIVPINISNVKSGNYQINLQGVSTFNTGIEILLADAYNKKLMPVHSNMLIDFSSSNYENRYSLIFRANGFKGNSMTEKFSEISVYPNPTSQGTINVVVPEFENAKLSISDAVGKVCMANVKLQSAKNIISTPFASGIYYINISSDNNTRVFKIVVIN
jgi:hypothetical protein